MHLENCVSVFRFLKINKVLTDNAEDLDIVMPMHNLIEYSKNYSKTFGALWSYYKDILTDPITNSEYKTSITGKTAIDGNKKEVFDFFVPLKHLRNFWRTLDLPLTNCEVCLTLT